MKPTHIRRFDMLSQPRLEQEWSLMLVIFLGQAREHIQGFWNQNCWLRFHQSIIQPIHKTGQAIWIQQSRWNILII